MTDRFNLIPAARLIARQRRVWRGRCVVTCAGYAAVVATLTVGARAVVGQGEVELPELLRAASAEVDRNAATLAKVRGDLESTESRLRSSRAIAEQPDWSALMSLLAARAGEQVVLKGFSVRPKDPPAVVAKPGAKPPAAGAKPVVPVAEPGVILNLAGAGRSQAAASQFALRLEATGLFDRVTLLDTTREVVADLPLVTFRVECTMGDPGAAKKTAAALAAAKSAKATSGKKPAKVIEVESDDADAVGSIVIKPAAASGTTSARDGGEP